jgi:hypothetical protein
MSVLDIVALLFFPASALAVGFWATRPSTWKNERY